jgi:hypothetical protein
MSEITTTAPQDGKTCGEQSSLAIEELKSPSVAVRRLAITKIAWYNELCAIVPLFMVALEDSDRDNRIKATGIAGRIIAANVDAPGFAPWALGVFGNILNGSDEAIKPAAEHSVERIIAAVNAYDAGQNGSLVGKAAFFATKHRPIVMAVGLVGLVIGAGYFYKRLYR